LLSCDPNRSAALRGAVLALAALAALATARGVHGQAAPASSTAPRTIRVTDETGRVLDLPQPARRIVSLAPNLTETLYALGAGDRIVGDTDYCDYPADAKTKAHVGGPVNPNLERVAALHPDLVLATRAINRQATVQSLQQIGIAVYTTDPRSVEQVLTSTERLASLVGADDEGRRVVADLRRRLATVHDRLAGVEPKSALFVTWEDPLITVGRDTFLADALRWAGVRLVIESPQDWPNVSLEEVVRLQPEYLIFATDEPEQFQRELGELHERSGWRDLEALRSGRIVLLSETIDRPSPRLLDGIEQLARAMHPERFAASGFPALPTQAAPPQTTVEERATARHGDR
jgi:iron complex transport system substrate-binding protein